MSEACELRTVYICACLCWNVQLYTCVCVAKSFRGRAHFYENAYIGWMCVYAYTYGSVCEWILAAGT